MKIIRVIEELDDSYYEVDGNIMTIYRRIDYFKLKIKYYMLTSKLPQARKFLNKLERWISSELIHAFDCKTDYIILHSEYHLANKEIVLAHSKLVMYLQKVVKIPDS